MDQCVIFCAGGFEKLAQPLQGSELVIAADGGLRHAQKLGITPDVVLGDFDSLGYTPQDANVFPVEKDDTDAMLAVRHGLKMGCRRFVLYGSMDGPRLDHTIANLQTLGYLSEHGANGYLVGEHYIAAVVRNGEIRFPATASGIISVFCMGPDATGVTIRGLQYPLENGCLTSAFPLGVSNHFTGQEACISVKDGALICLYDASNGLAPIREEVTP